MLHMVTVRTVSILTTCVALRTVGKLAGMRRLPTKQMGILSTPLMLILQRLFNVKRKLKIRTGLGVLEGPQTMTTPISMEHMAPIEHLKVPSRQAPRESGCSATGQRLDA